MSHIQEKVEIDPEMTEIMELVDEDFKTALMKYLEF